MIGRPPSRPPVWLISAAITVLIIALIFIPAGSETVSLAEAIRLGMPASGTRIVAGTIGYLVGASLPVIIVFSIAWQIVRRRNRSAKDYMMWLLVVVAAAAPAVALWVNTAT